MQIIISDIDLEYITRKMELAEEAAKKIAEKIKNHELNGVEDDRIKNEIFMAIKNI